MATPILITEKKIKEKELEQVLSIWYPIIFKDQTEALLDSRSKINIISQVFAFELGLKIWKTNVEAQKIDGTILETYKMIVSTISVLDKDNKKRFFKENFLLADVNPNVVLKIFFLTINNADVNFQAWDL